MSWHAIGGVYRPAVFPVAQQGAVGALDLSAPVAVSHDYISAHVVRRVPIGRLLRM